MKAHYLCWFLVVVSVVLVRGQGHDVVVGLERAESVRGPWVSLPTDAGWWSGGRVNAGRVTNDAGFYRLRGELVAVPTPSPTPAPVLPQCGGGATDRN